MKYTDQDATQAGPTALGAVRSIAVSTPAAHQLPADDPYLNVLAEFLLVAVPPSRWFRADHDPQPGRDVRRVFDGVFHYERVKQENGGPDAWRKIDPADDRYVETCSWAHFAGKIIVDSTQPRVGSFKINNPAPGGPVADWQATTPGGVAVMLEEALTVLRDRIAAGTADGLIGTQWTPDSHGPILMVSLGARRSRFATAGDQGDHQ